VGATDQDCTQVAGGGVVVVGGGGQNKVSFSWPNENLSETIAYYFLVSSSGGKADTPRRPDKWPSEKSSLGRGS